MTAQRRILAVASSAASVLAVAASAEAATVAALVPCVRTVDGVGAVPIGGTGFTPGSSVSVRSEPPGVFASAVTDAAGNFTARSSAPSFNPFARQLQTFTLTATDSVNPALVATSKYQQVRVGYSTNPPTGRPTRKATHTVRGLIPGKNIYLHWRFGGQTKRTVKVGKASAPCGNASRRMSLLPTKSHPGLWSLYADHAARYSKRTSPQLPYTFVIRRTFG